MSHSIDISLRWSEESWRISRSIDIALRWSATILRRNAFSKPVIDRKMSVACGKDYSDRDNGALSSNTPHCTPLECGTVVYPRAIDIALRWSATILRRNAFSKPVIDRKMSVACGKNYSDRDNGALLRFTMRTLSRSLSVRLIAPYIGVRGRSACRAATKTP